MSDFKCVPIETGIAEAIRSNANDPSGNLIRNVPSSETGAPCRHCLESVVPGETVRLASYDLPRPKGLYWTPSPIFVHATACQRYERCNHIPEIVRNSLVSLRSYDAEHQCIYDLGVVVDGGLAADLGDGS